VQALFVKRKFRQAPFEWVYDGLSPVLLPDVLHSHKGLCVVLSMLYILVAAPLGVDLVMMRVAPPAAEASLAGPSFAAQKCLGVGRLPAAQLDIKALAEQAEDGAKCDAL
jgi:Transglutaminase-like superfamily